MKSSNSAKLLKYCKAGNIKKVKELLINPEINLDINYQDINGNSSLIWACRNGNEPVVRLLLLGNKSNEDIPFDVTNYVENRSKKHSLFSNDKPNSDPNIQNVSINMTNIHGNTALTWACREGYTSIVQLLLAHGADPTIKNNMNFKALVYACKNGHTDVVKILLDSKVENKEELGINLKSGTYHYTSLIYACKNGDEEMALALLENGADVNVQTIDGDTALIWACKNQHQNIVELLLRYNALTYLKNNRGFTAFSWALYKKNKIIFNILHDNLFQSLINSPIMPYDTLSDNQSIIIDDKNALNYMTPPLTPQMNPTMSIATISPGSPSNITFINNNPNILENTLVQNTNKDLIIPASTTTYVSNSNLEGIDNKQIQPSPMSSFSFIIPNNNSPKSKITSYSCETTQVVSTTTSTTTRLSFSFNNNDSGSGNVEEPLIISKIEESTEKRSSLVLENIKNKNMNIELTSSQSKIEVGEISPNNSIAIVTKNVGGNVNFSNSLNRMIINLGRNSSKSFEDNDRNMAIVNENRNGNNFIQNNGSSIDQNNERCFSIMKHEYFLSTDKSSFPCLNGFVEYIQNKEKRNFFHKKTKFSLFDNEKSNIDLMEKLIEYGVNISNRLFNGCTALIISCIFGQEKFFQFLIEQNVDVNVPNSENWTALMVASQNGQLKMIQQLLQQNANTNYQNNFQETALIIASKEGHYEVVDKLLKFFSKINNKDNYGDAALIAACRGGYIKIVKLLLENNADVNIQNNYGETAIMIATEYNNLEIVQLLLDFNANIDMQNMNGWTALIMACYFGYENIVKYLIKHKADITIKDKNERTAFDVAEKRHLSNITKILEQADRHRKEKREKDKNYSEEEEEYLYSSESEWDSDSDNNDNEIVTEGALSSPSNSLPISKPKGDKEGISFTSKMNVQNSHQMDFESNPGNSCFENINNRKIVEKETEDSQTEISSVFDNNDNNSNNNDNNKMKALKKTKNEKRKRLSFHINDSIGVTLYQKIGWNKLHMVCMNGDIKQLNNLILENINLSERTVDGWSALHIAVSNNKIEVVKCLLDHGVDKNIENDSYTPLYIASQNGFNDIVKLLVEKYNADINKVTNGWSAIQIACSNGHYQTVEYLLSQGADIYLNSKKRI